MKKTLRTILLAGMAVVAASCGNSEAPKAGAPMAADPNAAIKVNVATATFQNVPQDEIYTATVEANATNNIAPQTGSRIQKINVEIGDFVRAGQVLAEMDKLQLQQAKLQMVNDSTELSRLRKLYEQGALAKADLESMELAYNVRQATYQNLLENTILRSPINGVVTARNYDKGDMYTMGRPLYTVQEITPVKLIVGISESDYTKIKKGDSVMISADALPGRSFSGKINKIYPTMEAGTHTVNVEIVVPNSDRVLRPGMYTKVEINYANNHSIVVPDIAIVKMQGSGQKTVYVVNGDNTVSLKVVKLGRHFGSNYEILEGLEEGDVVVTKGNSNVKSGSKIEIIG